MNNALLCPCCAAHLEPPPQLHLMRCDNCHAELAVVREGGVSGLAVLPPAAMVPYSTPSQRAARSHQVLDTAALVAGRRAACLESAVRRESNWTIALRVMVITGILAAAVGARAFSMLESAKRNAEVELAVMILLGAVLVLPVVVFVGLFFQGCARMAREDVNRWYG